METKSKIGHPGPTLIRFDWAFKRLMRQKANYKVLEGFLSVLLGETVKIISIRDSESNQTNAMDKFNRVDIFVENTHGELIIIELQSSSEADYFLRMLYGVSKDISEHISLGDSYGRVRKVYHINIVYFKLGHGRDYVYHGTTEFRGIHQHDILRLTGEQKQFFEVSSRKNTNEVRDLFPEYYILCVKDFDDVAKDSLDEWLYYLKNNTIPAGFKAPGLKEARKQLQYDNLSAQDRIDYDHHIKQRLHEQSAITTAIIKGEIKGEAKGFAKGHAEGLAEGEAKGEAKGRAAERAEMQENVILNGHRAGYSIEIISIMTGLTPDRVTEILKRHGLI
jgi:predicted transposase/invertase (TIGR01784 family)